MTSALTAIVIPRRGPACAGCATAFEEKMRYTSVLIDHEAEEEYIRRDYCETCWGEPKEEEYRHKRAVFWCSAVPERKKREAPKTYNEKALALLRELVKSDKEKDSHLAFVVALFLERKRNIALRKVYEGVAWYEDTTTEDMLPVRRVTLSDLDMAALEEEFNARVRDGG
jgi:hypothetical protein